MIGRLGDDGNGASLLPLPPVASNINSNDANATSNVPSLSLPVFDLPLPVPPIIYAPIQIQQTLPQPQQTQSSLLPSFPVSNEVQSTYVGSSQALPMQGSPQILAPQNNNYETPVAPIATASLLPSPMASVAVPMSLPVDPIYSVSPIANVISQDSGNGGNGNFGNDNPIPAMSSRASEGNQNPMLGVTGSGNPYPVDSAAYKSFEATYNLGLKLNPSNPGNPYQGAASYYSMQGETQQQIVDRADKGTLLPVAINVNAGCSVSGSYDPFNPAPWPPKAPCAVANLGLTRIPSDWPDPSYFDGPLLCPDGTAMSKNADCPGRMIASPLQSNGTLSNQIASVQNVYPGYSPSLDTGLRLQTTANPMVTSAAVNSNSVAAASVADSSGASHSKSDASPTPVVTNSGVDPAHSKVDGSVINTGIDFSRTIQDLLSSLIPSSGGSTAQPVSVNVTTANPAGVDVTGSSVIDSLMQVVTDHPVLSIGGLALVGFMMMSGGNSGYQGRR